VSEARRGRRWFVLLAALAAGCLLAGFLLLRSLQSAPSDGGGDAEVGDFLAQAATVPPPARSPLRLGKVAPLRSSGALFRWAAVLRQADARKSPDHAAPVIARVAAVTTLGTTNIVLVLGHVITDDGVWVRVRLPALPSDTTGWLPRSVLGGYHFVRTHLVIDLARYTITLFREGRAVFGAPIAVGRKQWPTPKGEFYVRERLTKLESPFYGPVAFGTSARSSVLTDWPDGGQIGIHGTNRPELIPGEVSHGCVRMRNADILRLSRLLPVGTPLTIV
jgi:lipoprotein-anchoring transpeptidase ErfK/SrfK